MVQQIMERKLNMFGHMQDEGQKTGEGGDVWNDGGRDKERKNVSKNGWTTSRNGVERKFTYSTGGRRIEARQERWCRRHWTPADAEPMRQWMNGLKEHA